MNSYRELDIYNKSKELAVEIHKMSLSLPKFELYEEGSQIRRSAKSIAANIVEGYGRKKYKAEFIRYLIFSIAECDETILHLDLLFETKSLQEQAVYDHLRNEYESLSKMINNFIKYVDQNWKTR